MKYVSPSHTVKNHITQRWVIVRGRQPIAKGPNDRPTGFSTAPVF